MKPPVNENWLMSVQWKLQHGASLLEILITILIVAFALLGIAGLQLASVRYQQTAHLRATAMTQVQTMAERLDPIVAHLPVRPMCLPTALQTTTRMHQQFP